MEKWTIFIFISIIFFVLGQTFLKYDPNDGIVSACYFTISMGITGFLVLLYILQNNKNVLNNEIMFSLLAGIVFFFGNMFWIFSIKSAPSLSTIRTIMAGGETLLLLLVGFIIFKQTLTIQDVIGMILILLGVNIISLK